MRTTEQVLSFAKLTPEHWRQLVTDKQAQVFHRKRWLAVRWLHDLHRGVVQLPPVPHCLRRWERDDGR